MPEFDPAIIASEAGTVRSAFTLERITLAPPLGAAFVRLTEHVLEELGASDDGLQLTDDTLTGATTAMVALAEVLL
jgi:hypothetical protein